MKWIDYTALTLAIIGAIVWGLIGVFQFNLVSFFFGENSWYRKRRPHKMLNRIFAAPILHILYWLFSIFCVF